MYAEIAVGGKARLLLHYDIPAELTGRLAPGHLVCVPLRDKERFGVVIALSSAAAVAKTRPLLELVDPVPAVSPDYLDLARWLAGFYLASLADCVWLMAYTGLPYSMHSYHSQGVNCALADGSVRFLSETMDEQLILDLAHMKNGAPIGGFPP